MEQRKHRFMCPHCGKVFNRKWGIALIPKHSYPPTTRQLCPGSQQVPRNPDTDHRRLWKDGGEDIRVY